MLRSPSFVLGLCSPFTCPLTSIPAIVLGIRGLNDIKNPKNRLTGRPLAISGILLGAIAPLLAVFLLPPVLTAFTHEGDAPRRAQCINNLKVIALAMKNYEGANGCFPPVAIFDKDGKPLLSWRVLILPYVNEWGLYMEETSLYKQFHLDESWDSPHNRPLADRAPMMFRCPSKVMPDGLTTYKVVVDPHSMFTGQPAGVPLKSVTDGATNTLFWSRKGRTPFLWSKLRRSTSLTSNKPSLGMGSKHRGGFNAALVDGWVQLIESSISLRLLKGLATRDGNESATLPP